MNQSLILGFGRNQKNGPQKKVLKSQLMSEENDGVDGQRRNSKQIFTKLYQDQISHIKAARENQMKSFDATASKM